MQIARPRTLLALAVSAAASGGDDGAVAEAVEDCTATSHPVPLPSSFNSHCSTFAYASGTGK